MTQARGRWFGLPQGCMSLVAIMVGLLATTTALAGLQNPSFEKGLEPWTSVEGEVTCERHGSAARHGNCFFHVATDAGHTVLAQEFAAATDGRWMAKAYVRGRGQVSLQIGKRCQGLWHYAAARAKLKSDWTLLRVRSQAGTGCDALSVKIVADGGTTLDVDRVQLGAFDSVRDGR